jgi:hypothetical protein
MIMSGFTATGNLLPVSSRDSQVTSAYNNGLLERLHRDDLPMQQAVMLAIYLVSQSKKFERGSWR